VAGFFSKRRAGTRTNPDAVELALDLTADSIVLHERATHGGWRKFAAAQLDDPEFPIVIGLLRNEAESQSGGRQPVRLWLPGEQILKRQVRIDAESPAERLKAAFDYVDSETVYRSQDVAVAVAPQARSGKTTLLITFAETWREARDYAERWGFLPGVVSTRHHSGDFGADGPDFRMKSHPAKAAAPVSRKRVPALALVAAAIAAGTAIWAYDIWTPRGETAGGMEAQMQAAAPAPAESAQAAEPEKAAGVPPEPAPRPLPAESGTIVTAEIAPLPTLDPDVASKPGPEPSAGMIAETVADPAIETDSTPPSYLLDHPVLAAFVPTAQPPDIATAPQRAEVPAPPEALWDAPVAHAVPSPPPSHEPAPPERDPVVTWTGPTPVLTVPEQIPPVTAAQIVRDTGTPVAERQLATLAQAVPEGLQGPPGPPEVQPPAAETAQDAAEPVLAQATRSEPQQAAPEDPAEDDPREETAATDFAPLTSAAPPRRPALAEPEIAETPAVEPEFVAMVMPPPRPVHLGRPETAAAPTEPDPALDTAEAPAEPSTEVATEPEIAVAPEAAAVPEGAADPNAEIVTALAPQATVGEDAAAEPVPEPDPDAPTQYASLSAPMPPARPALPALPEELPSAALLPISGAAQRSIQEAATEHGLPLDRASLIGILNLDTGRKALLRLPNGRYRSVVVGDVLDGWRVSLIGTDAMRITRSGQDHTLLLVNR
jgi:hypothetical protein